jgi:hypothetical protein
MSLMSARTPAYVSCRAVLICGIPVKAAAGIFKAKDLSRRAKSQEGEGLPPLPGGGQERSFTQRVFGFGKNKQKSPEGMTKTRSLLEFTATATTSSASTGTWPRGCNALLALPALRPRNDTFVAVASPSASRTSILSRKQHPDLRCRKRLARV